MDIIILMPEVKLKEFLKDEIEYRFFIAKLQPVKCFCPSRNIHIKFEE